MDVAIFHKVTHSQKIYSIQCQAIKQLYISSTYTVHKAMTTNSKSSFPSIAPIPHFSSARLYLFVRNYLSSIFFFYKHILAESRPAQCNMEHTLLTGRATQVLDRITMEKKWPLAKPWCVTSYLAVLCIIQSKGRI